MRTVVMGAGRSGLAAARFLAAQGIGVVVTDRRQDPGPDLEIALAKAGIPGVWGDHPFALLDGCDGLVVSPGIPRTNSFIAEAIVRIHRGQSVGALFTSEVRFTQEMLLWDVDSAADRITPSTIR